MPTLCNVTGTVYDRAGNVAVSKTLVWVPAANNYEADGVSVFTADAVQVTTNSSGAVDFDIAPGNYVVYAQVSANPKSAAGKVLFHAGVPSEASVGLASIIERVAEVTTQVAVYAAASATAAQASATAAATALDEFTDLYLGELATDPTTDNDGDPLQGGATYFNSTTSEWKVYSGGVWVVGVSTGARMFDNVADMVVATGVQVGDYVTVPSAYNGTSEIFKIVAAATYTANGQEVINLTGGSGQAVSTRMWFKTVAELLADTREAGFFAADPAVAVDAVFEAAGFRFEQALSGASDEHVTTAGGVKLYALPGVDGFCHFEQFGGVYGDRSAAATNGAAINTALAYCGNAGYGLDLGTGIIFNSVPIVQTKLVNVRGAGVSYLTKQYNTMSAQAPTAIVMTGTGSKDQTLFGVSSCRAWGADRTNPSPQAGYNDATYRLNSFVTENTLASGRSLKAFSVAWKISNLAAVGSRLDGFRIMPDAGGTDGMEDMQSSDRTVTKALSSGDWDVGLWVQGVREFSAHSVQAVGQWRMRIGLLLTPHAKAWADGAALYNTNFHGCTFSGLSIRSVDGAPVVATTSTTVDIPWADDHPFGADGDLDLILTTGGRGGDGFTYTGMTKVTGGSYDILRFTGVSPDPTTSSYANCYPGYVGGGTSHLAFKHCEFQGFGHGSLEPSENTDLGGTGTGPFDHPMANIEINGNEITEIDFGTSAVCGYETVAIHKHDCRNIILPTYYEMNNEGRIIASPHRAANTYTVDATVPAISETLDVVFEPHGSTIDGGTLDMRPYITQMGTPTRFSNVSDTGFFEAVKLRSNRFGTTTMLGMGTYLSAAGSGEVAIGEWVSKPSFFDGDVPTDASVFDRWFYGRPSETVLRARRTIQSNTAGQVDIGSRTGPFGTSWALGNLSHELIIADDDVASFTPQRKGGILAITVYNGEDLPLNAVSGLIFFDVGPSLNCVELPWTGLGGNLTVSTSDVTGTTGTNGYITVAVQTDTVKIENRSGGNRIVRISILG